MNGKHLHGQKNALYLKNFIFGVEDSLASSVGMLSGIAIAGTTRETIILAGIVLIFVEAFSMGVGSFLSEQASESFIEQTDAVGVKSLLGAVVMWASYFAAGFIPLSPYIFLDPGYAFGLSIFASLLGLFILGMVGARFSHIKIVRGGFRMLLIGGMAVILGVVVGFLVNSYLMKA